MKLQLLSSNNVSAPYNEYGAESVPLDAQNASTHPQSYIFSSQPADPMTSHINAESIWAMGNVMHSTFAPNTGPPTIYTPKSL